MSERKKQRRPETHDDVKVQYTSIIELSDITVEFERLILNKAAKRDTIFFLEHRAEELKFVERVMNEAQERSNMSLILPILLKNPETVENVLQNTPYEPAIRLVQEYKDHAADALIIPPLLDARKLEIIDYFHQNYKLYKLFPKYAIRLNKNDRDIRDIFKMLTQTAMLHLINKPSDNTIEEHEALIRIRETQELTRIIRRLQNIMCRRLLRQRWRNAARSVVLIKTAKEYLIEQQKNVIMIDQELVEIKALKMIDYRNSMIRLRIKRAEVKVAQGYYAKARAKVEQLESVVRGEKNKQELQLRAQAKKYDQIMFDLFKKIMQAQKRRDQAQRVLNEYLHTYYYKVAAVYKQLILIPRQQVNREKEKRIDLYRMNRAAKKIQKYWRKWRKALRKKQRLAEKAMEKKKKNY